MTPEPGFTLKTRTVSTGSKIFINVCSHEEIGVPAMKKKIGADGEPVEGLNVPMSIGANREGADKSGSSCTIYDVIVNPGKLLLYDEYHDFKST